MVFTMSFSYFTRLFILFKQGVEMKQFSQIPPLSHRLQNQEKIKKLEQQVQVLLEQQKNLLEYIKELAITITETRIDKSNK